MIFSHPENPDLVIKVPNKTNKSRKRGIIHRLFARSSKFGPQWSSFVEIRELTRSVSFAGRVPENYAQFSGFVETNLGPAATFETVYGPDGKLAETLTHHAESNDHEPAIEDAITALWAECQRSWLVFSDRHLDNVVVTGNSKNGYRLIIVDGVGDRALFPFRVWSKRVYDKKCGEYRTAMISKYRSLTTTTP